jgi:hypothetical protein
MVKNDFGIGTLFGEFELHNRVGLESNPLHATLGQFVGPAQARYAGL